MSKRPTESIACLPDLVASRATAGRLDLQGPNPYSRSGRVCPGLLKGHKVNAHAAETLKVNTEVRDGVNLALYLHGLYVCTAFEANQVLLLRLFFRVLCPSNNEFTLAQPRLRPMPNVAMTVLSHFLQTPHFLFCPPHSTSYASPTPCAAGLIWVSTSPSPSLTPYPCNLPTATPIRTARPFASN
jgi:hypothetical protein